MNILTTLMKFNDRSASRHKSKLFRRHYLRQKIGLPLNPLSSTEYTVSWWEDDFVIEIVEHTLLIGNQRPVSPERAVYLAEFVARLSTMC